MPYSKDDLSKLPPSTKSLTHKEKLKFVEVFNALVKDGMKESQAIPLAISQSRKSLKKSNMEESNELLIMKAVHEEEMIAIEVIYEPFKLDAHGQWMSAETISKACDNFNKNLASGNVKPNLFHAMETQKFEILDSWIQKVDCFVGEQFVPEGTWIGKIHYLDNKLWELKKSGVIKGVSIGAKGRVIYPDLEED